ncbi:hypothetical protein Y1Q_0011702 [Alligator mississippiensis]|uniref:Uncharacterized protein n=1 Tax=Alligator mississippiensis TaxID=8496 RepID=A0A151M0V8_ALLMI|nr:hypothetical protein Y1Q_0011702 [Alligator mississippiensis]
MVEIWTLSTTSVCYLHADDRTDSTSLPPSPLPHTDRLLSPLWLFDIQHESTTYTISRIKQATVSNYALEL